MPDVHPPHSSVFKVPHPTSAVHPRELLPSEPGPALEAVLEHIPEGLTIASAPDVTVQWVSRYGQELTGRPLARLVGIPSDLHPDHWQVYHADGVTPASADDLPLTRATKEGAVIRNEEWVLRRPDGECITILCNAGPIRAASGTITGGVIVWRDIDERKRRQRHLEQLQEIGVALADTVTVTQVAKVAVEHVRRIVGATALALVRPTPEDGAVVELLDSEGFPNDKLSEWHRFPLAASAPVTDAMRDLRPVGVNGPDEVRARYPLTAELVLSSGMPHWLAVPCLASERTSPRAVGCLTMAFATPRSFDDIEQQFLISIARQVGQALERARLYEAERRARYEAEEASRAKGYFLASLAHEFRTPLTVFTNQVEILKAGLQGAVTEGQHRTLSRMEAVSAHLARLIDDVLDHAKNEAGMLSYAHERVDVQAAVAAVAGLLEPQRIAKGLLWSADVVGERHVVLADREKVVRVLLNLLSNAIKFTPAGGTVGVRLSVEESWTVIEVVDTGIGIAPEKLSTLFDPFTQVISGPADIQMGTGLGLTISRDLANGMGGDLTAGSTVGVGSTFRFRLPAAPTSER